MPLDNIVQLLNTRQIGGDQIETAVAKAYLTAHIADFDRVEFNVRLGPGDDPGITYPDYIRKMAIANSQLKADMVCYRGDVPTIVEVKDRAKPSVLGQILTYWHAMRADNPKLLNVYRVVAARTAQQGIGPIMYGYGVTMELFPAASPPSESTT
jgi:hypothetical protein